MKLEGVIFIKNNILKYLCDEMYRKSKLNFQETLTSCQTYSVRGFIVYKKNLISNFKG